MRVQIAYHGSPPNQSVHVTIYYWEHDQAEERPLEEFFRGDANSLIQWQPAPQMPVPVAGLPVQGVQGVPVHGMAGGGFEGVAMQGMPMQSMGAMPAGAAMFAHGTGQHVPFGNMQQAPGSMLNGVRALAFRGAHRGAAG